MSLQSQNPYHRSGGGGGAQSSRFNAPSTNVFASTPTTTTAVVRDGFDFIDDHAGMDEEDGTDSGLTCRLMMTGLPLEQISERDVADLFEEYLGAGAVRSAKVLYGSDRLALGAAIVTLARHRDVRRAYACFNGKVIDGKSGVFIHYILNLDHPVPQPVQNMLPGPPSVPSAPGGGGLKLSKQELLPTAPRASLGSRMVPGSANVNASPHNRQQQQLQQRIPSGPAAAAATAASSANKKGGAGAGAPKTTLKSTAVELLPVKGAGGSVKAVKTIQPAAGAVAGKQGGQQSKGDLLKRFQFTLKDRIAAGGSSSGPTKSGSPSPAAGAGSMSNKAKQLDARLRANPQLQVKAKAQAQAQKVKQQQQQQQQAQQQAAKQKQQQQQAQVQLQQQQQQKAKPKTQAELDEELKMIQRRRKFEGEGAVGGGMDTS